MNSDRLLILAAAIAPLHWYHRSGRLDTVTIPRAAS